MIKFSDLLYEWQLISPSLHETSEAGFDPEDRGNGILRQPCAESKQSLSSFMDMFSLVVCSGLDTIMIL